MVAVEGGHPVLQHPDQVAGLDIGLNDVFRNARQARSSQGCRQDVRAATECELPLDPHIEATATMFELPGIIPAMGG